MNRTLLNTLYVADGGVYVHLENETAVIERDKEKLGRVPLHHLSGMVLDDRAMVSPGLLRACGERGVSVSWFDRGGRYVAAMRGPTRGNVLLRLAQYDVYRDDARKLELARALVRGKVTNARHTLARRARDAQGEDREQIRSARQKLDGLLKVIGGAQTVDELRGYEGASAKHYFGAFDAMVAGSGFEFDGRSRRPPRDPFNALLSFVYTLITIDCVGACEGVGLDPQVGWLHEVRPGRPACALDLVEEMRAAFADRLVFTLINRRQVTLDGDFEERQGGAVYLSDGGRKSVLEAYHKRKNDTIQHAVLKEKIPFGLVPHIQARLLARHLRGDLEQYTPFEYR